MSVDSCWLELGNLQAFLSECDAMNRIEKEADGTYKVYYKNKDGESFVKAGIVMFGTGRSPNTRNIGLEVRPHFSQLQTLMHQLGLLVCESAFVCHGNHISAWWDVRAALL